MNHFSLHIDIVLLLITLFEACTCLYMLDHSHPCTAHVQFQSPFGSIHKLEKQARRFIFYVMCAETGNLVLHIAYVLPFPSIMGICISCTIVGSIWGNYTLNKHSILINTVHTFCSMFTCVCLFCKPEH
jgi:hypothetical protein